MGITGHDKGDPRFNNVANPDHIMTSAGIPVLLPEPKTHVYRAATSDPVASPALSLTFSPVVPGVTVQIAIGAGPVAVAAVGNAIQVTALLPGTTTYANLLAAWNGAPAVVALAALTGDAGTFPAGYLGLAATALATTRVAEGIGLIGYCDDGVWRPVKFSPAGAQAVTPYLPVDGAAPTVQVGDTARVPQDWIEDFDGVAGTWHPLVGGVRVICQIGAGPVTSTAAGRTVTIGDVLPGGSTIANIQAAIAADPASALLLTIAGAGVIGAAYIGQAGRDLWYAGTAAPGIGYALDEAGQVSPIESVTGVGVKTQDHPYLPATSGAVPTQVQGTSGLLPADWAETYDVGVVGTWHPLVNGVRVIETLGAGVMTATAVGRVVTITNVNVGVSTIANIIAAIAAAPTVVPLVALTGAGIVGAAYAGNAGYDLWYSGTIPVGCMFALGPDGYNWPVELDATGGVKISMSSLIEGEDTVNHVMKVEQQFAPFGAEQSASATLINGAGFVGVMWATCTSAGGTILIRDAVADGAGTLLATIAPAAAEAFGPEKLPHGFKVTTGLRVTISAGTWTFNGAGRW